MNFKDNKAIYLQIADRIGDQILSTVARTYEYLQQCGVIFTKRGLGYFVCPDASEKIIAMRREQLMQGEMDYFFGQLKAVGITPTELQEKYQEYLKH